MLQLPAEGETAVDVLVEKGLDEAGESAGGGTVVKEGVGGGGGEDAGFQDLAAFGEDWVAICSWLFAGTDYRGFSI